MLEAEGNSSRPRTILASRPACLRGLKITGRNAIKATKPGQCFTNLDVISYDASEDIAW